MRPNAQLPSEKRRKLVSDLYKDTETLELRGVIKGCPHCNSKTIYKHGKHNEE